MDDNKKIIYLYPADIKTRALHYFTDYILIKIILLKLFATFAGVDLEKLEFEAMLGFIYKVELLWILYISLGEFFFQKTIGKLISRTVVVNMEGNKAKPSQITLRTLIRLIPFEFISYFILGYFLHDEWSKTAVVYKENTGMDD